MLASNSTSISLLTLVQLLKSHAQFVLRAGCLFRWTHGLLQARGNLCEILRRRRNGGTDRALRFHKTQVVRGVAGTGRLIARGKETRIKRFEKKTFGDLFSLTCDDSSQVLYLLFSSFGLERRKHGVGWLFACPSYARLCSLCCELRFPACVTSTTGSVYSFSASFCCAVFYLLRELLTL